MCSGALGGGADTAAQAVKNQFASTACIVALRSCLQAGGVGLVWCGIGLPHTLATQNARREGVRLLAALGIGDVHMSRSGCEGLAAIALSLSCAVGIDVEAVDAVAAQDMLAWLHPDDLYEIGEGHPLGSHDATAAWTRKEAALKALGVGLSVTPRQFAAGCKGAEWRPVCVGQHGQVNVRSVPTPSVGTLAALAVRSSSCPRILTFVR